MIGKLRICRVKVKNQTARGESEKMKAKDKKENW